MYAKLKFLKGTKNTEICRDIVRAITNSDGAGGSTVGALEFVDAGNSTIDDTVAANWTLAAGQSISTGAPVEQDKEFFLQQAHANTATKTVSIRMFNKDTTGFTKAENSAGYQSVVLRAVLDYGETYQVTPLVPNDSSSATTTLSPGVGVSAWGGDTTVHVIARDKVIAIFGDRWSYYGGRSFEAVLEAPTQYENIIGRNKPSQTYFHSSEMLSTSFGAAGMSAKSYVVDFSSTNVMSINYAQPLGYFMMDTLHEKTTDSEVRILGMHKISWTTYTSSPSNSDPSSQMSFCAPLRDTGQADGFDTTWNHGTTGTFSPESYIFPAGSSSWAYTQHAYSFDPTNSLNSALLQNQTPTDPSGNPAVQLQPVVFRLGNNGGYYDFASECGLYVGTTNVPRGISVLTDGADSYVSIRAFDTGSRDGVVVLKV